MTRTTNARLAGFMFLLYIAAGVIAMIVFDQAAPGDGVAEKLASIAENQPLMGVVVWLTSLTILAALTLGVTLYSITCDEDADLALLALSCRVGEGAINAVPALAVMSLIWISRAEGFDAAATSAIGALLLNVRDWSMLVAATVFAVGSLLYSVLFLRARSIPRPLARLGVFASTLLIGAVSLQLAGWFRGPATWLAWLPMLVFELVLAFWLLIRGVSAPSANRASA